jgi:molybdopterin-guanine dinucleotide biosynthesis protein A
VGVAQQFDGEVSISTPSEPARAAIVLAGGTSTRMGVDKLALQRFGRSVLRTVVDETRRYAQVVIVVGQIRDEIENVDWTVESPPGGGPLAGLAAGLTVLHARETTSLSFPRVALVAGDAPRGPRALPELHTYAEQPGFDGALLVDDTGRDHPLSAVYDVGALTRALRTLGTTDGGSVHGGSVHGGSVHGGSMRSLTDQLNLARVADRWGATADLDTPLDAQREGYSLPE